MTSYNTLSITLLRRILITWCIMETVDYKHYQVEIDKIIVFLQRDTTNLETFDKVQLKLDSLAKKYQDDETLGNSRYKLYQAQAMLSFRLGDLDKSIQFIDLAVETRGENYDFADELRGYINQELPLESNAKWVVLIVLPFISFTVIALLQVLLHFLINNGSDSISNIDNILKFTVNILSVIVGIFSVMAFLLIPLWIIMILKTNRRNISGNHGLSKNTAVLLAVFLGLWSWVYTYERNKTKFWVCLGLLIPTVGYFSIVAWIWAIIDATSKPDEYYEQYPNFIA